MTTVTLTQNYEIVIPHEIREQFKLVPGQKIHISSYDNKIEVIPEKKIKNMRGFLSGVNTSFEREADRL